MAQVFSLCYNMVTVSVLVSWRNRWIFGWMQDVRILADCYGVFLLDMSKKLNSDGANHLAENQFFTQVCPCYRTLLEASSYNYNLITPPIMVSQHFWFVNLGRHFSGHFLSFTLGASCLYFLFSSLNIFEDVLSSLKFQKWHVENFRSVGSVPFGRVQLFLSV